MADQAGSEQQEQQQQPDQGKKKDLPELLQRGDPVEFIVAASSQDGVRHKGTKPPKLMAKQVRLTLAFVADHINTILGNRNPHRERIPSCMRMPPPLDLNEMVLMQSVSHFYPLACHVFLKLHEAVLTLTRNLTCV